MPLIPAMQRQTDVWEVEASLVCIGSSRSAEASGRPCVKKMEKKKKITVNLTVTWSIGVIIKMILFGLFGFCCCQQAVLLSFI